MDKFAIDLDKVLDELELNDDSDREENREHPPSLLKIASCNTFGYSNNYPLIYSYREQSNNQKNGVVSSQLTSQLASTSQSNSNINSNNFVHQNNYKRVYSTYADSHAIEKLDSSEAEFGISSEPINAHSMTHSMTHSNTVTQSDDNEEDIKKNSLISSLLEHAKWNTETANQYDMNSSSTSSEDLSDEVLYISIDQKQTDKTDDTPNQSSASDDQIQIRLLPSNSSELVAQQLSADFIKDDLINNNEETCCEARVENEDKSLELEDISNESDEKNLSKERVAENVLNSINNESSHLMENKDLNNICSNDENELDSNVYRIEAITELNDKMETTGDNVNENDSTPIKYCISNVDIEDNDLDNYLSDLIESDVNDEHNESLINAKSSIDNNNLISLKDENICELNSNICNVDQQIKSQMSSNTLNSLSEQINTCDDLSVSNELNNCVTNENSNFANDAQLLDNSSKLSLRPTSLSILPTVSINSSVNENVDNSELEALQNENINLLTNYNSHHLVNNVDLYNGLSEEELMLGKVKPFWIPDNESQMCMHCDIKFTVIKRRHHCRACGKVLCAQCCNHRAKLIYLDNKDARVCQICFTILERIKELEVNTSDSTQSSPLESTLCYDNNADGRDHNIDGCDQQGLRSPDPNNPSEYCSTISPLEQVQDVMNRPPLTVLVPVGVLKRGDRRRGEPKQVKFSDGIRPGGDLTETSESAQSLEFPRRLGRIQLKLKSPPVENPSSSNLAVNKTKNSRVVISDQIGNLPPIINYYELTCDAMMKSKPSILLLIEIMKNKDLPPVIFAVTKNLRVHTKLVIKDCCVQSECWTFATKGLATIGQDEMLITFERLPEENIFPRDIFRLFTTVYDNASKGTAFNDLSHIFFPDGLFGNKDNSGFLFIRPSLQCFNKLILPSPPFLIGVLIHKWEIPWAKIFPLRLVLRLGAEYRYYPCPIVSYRFRKPAYCEIGHTIMNVLADFRNFQYTLPTVSGLVIHLEDKKTTVYLPRNRYEKVLKVLNNSNEHVLAFGANFSLKADSHLVCMQNDDGQYQTQAINIEGASRKITGASFIVFSGALKSSTGLTAKMSIVEDGLLVQIPPNTMSELRNSLKDMKDYVIECGKINILPPDETIHLSWTEEDNNVNLGVRSPIDGLSLEGVHSVRIYSGTDYANDKFVIRWTEIFFLQMNEVNRRSDSLDPSRLAESTSQAFCLALTPCLDLLFDNGLTKIGLRINLDMDKVGYEVGSKGLPLPSSYTSELDGALIPVIMESIATGVEDLLVMELIFHILIK